MSPSRRFIRVSLCAPVIHGPLTVTRVAYTTTALLHQRRTSQAADGASLKQHPLYGVLKARLGSPSAPLPSNQVYAKLVNPCRLVDEFNFAKTSKRLARQHAAFRFLRRHNVLMHGLLFYVQHTETWNTTQEFARLSLVGESVIRAEVRGRLLKLFPDMSHDAFATCAAELTSCSSLASLFDALRLDQIVGAKPPPRESGSTDAGRDGTKHTERAKAAQTRAKVTLDDDAKCAMLCAVVGEMHWFAARTKATDRTHNNALFPPSDVLILHVLCTHLLECVPAELIFGKLQPMIQHLRSVWVNEPMSLPSQLLLKPRTIAALSLSSSSHSPTAEELRWRTVSADATTVPVRALTEAPDTDYLKSYMRPRFSHRHFDSLWLQAVSPPHRRAVTAGLLAQPSVKASSEPDPNLWNENRRRELARADVASKESIRRDQAMVT